MIKDVLRRLQTHWAPRAGECPLEWEVLVLLARKP
jgi:hypothetical protein